MSLVTWNPEVSSFPNFAAWMDDFFADNSTWFKPMIKGVSIPAVNIKEDDTTFALEVAAPGFKKEDFNLEVKDGCLTITGASKSENETKDNNYTRREYSYNNFSRSFTLPKNVKSDEIDAKYVDGILRLILPKSKTEAQAVKKISVG